MKRCQKAVYGFKGRFSSETFFKDVLALKEILGGEAMVLTQRWGAALQPNWFIAISSTRSWSPVGTVDFTIYVNDSDIAMVLSLTYVEIPPSNVAVEFNNYI